MWNNLSLRVKITFLTAIILTFMCVCLTFISILNTDVFYEPIVSIIEKNAIDEDSIANETHKQINGITNVDIAGELYIGSRNRFKYLSIIASMGIVLIGTLISYVLTGKTLKSLNNFTNKIMKIDENNLNELITLSSSDDEVLKLTESFNHMLEKLDYAFDSKKLFAANAAHELKTPLTNILTNIEVVQMDCNPSIEDYQVVLGITKENVERLTTLVQELLYFNSELDESNFECIQTDLLFERIISDLSPDINEKNIKVIVEGNIHLMGDKNLLKQAFFNVIQNAVKYNRENGEISIKSFNNTIIIEDTGIGIPEEYLSLIFDPFYCVDKSRSRKLGGVGLGLSITKQIFSKHNMRITVLSQIEKGTKVVVEI